MRKENPKYPQIDITRCSCCGACILICSTQVLVTATQSKFPRLENPQNCTFCAQCEEICPTGAISVPFEITWDHQSRAL